MTAPRPGRYGGGHDNEPERGGRLMPSTTRAAQERVAPVRRPHTWPCRHCAMVEDYRLSRAAQVTLAEGVFWQDEDYRLVTFKDWLRSFAWETEPDPTPTRRDQLAGCPAPAQAGDGGASPGRPGQPVTR